MAVFGVLHFMPASGAGGNFWGFLAMFLLLFLTTGIGNGSTFRMIPVIFLTERQREAAGADPAQVRRDAAKESAAVLASARRWRPMAPSSCRRATAPRLH